MIDRHWILLLLLPLVSCRGAAADGSRALATANLAALEETVDLGELPLGGSREVRIRTRNGSDKSVTFAVQGIVPDE
ncbi:hypothetical protein [Alistipes dispar]|uniref:hypothetical protein n=1 Tax=Alistipes dispar TaxID=2585119 RepID=UPI003A855736